MNLIGYKKFNLYLDWLRLFLSFVDLEVDCFITSKCCKDWDILPAIPIVKAIKTNFWTENETLYKNYDFNSGVFIVSKSKELLIDLIEIAKKFWIIFQKVL